ncbi:futalosine hydrolase [Solitalea koreensis]|nr:futalosine hydrolase [Solitalea koreensis]
MKLLLVAATKAEIQPFINIHPHTDVLITGVGMVATTYHLTKHLAKNSYDLVINAGIAGAFDRSIKLGEVIQVISEELPELGAEDGDHFVSLTDLGFMNPNEFPFTNGKLINNFRTENLKSLAGVTVNTVNGNESSIQKMVERCTPDVESMEGAAFFYVCLQENVKFIQLRSISNHVEKRNRANWDIPLAIKHLNNYLIEYVNKIY